MDDTIDLETSPILLQSSFTPGSLIMKRYSIQRKLGSGSFATTYLAMDLKDEEAQKVIKRIPCHTVKADATLPSAAEARLLGSLRHPFIVRFLGSFLEREDFCIVTEYCEGGDLHYHIEQQKDKGFPFSEGHILEWFIQLLLGVNYLHERFVLHRDLKTRNIFLQNGTLKIGDFGVSRVLVPSDLATTLTGTASYMSPEIFTGEGYNTKSDIWSLGCILYEMCTFRRAFDCPRWIKLVFMIVNDPCPDLPGRYSAALQDILQRMLAKDPELRPSAQEILKLPYIADRIQALSEWLQEVLNYDRQVSVDEDAARIAAAVQEKLHLDSLRAMREVQEMAPRQRRRIRREEQPGMTKIRRAVERVYRENHQKLEEDKEHKVSKKSAWMDHSAHLSDDDQEVSAGLCSEEEEEAGEEEETYSASVLTLSLPLSEQQSTMLSAYQSCLRRVLDSSTETHGTQDTFFQDPEEWTLSDGSGEETEALRQECIQLLGEDAFQEVYHYLKQIYNQQDGSTLSEEDQSTLGEEDRTLREPPVMGLQPQHCYKVQKLLLLEERIGDKHLEPDLASI